MYWESNRKSGSLSRKNGSPPYFYFRFGRQRSLDDGFCRFSASAAALSPVMLRQSVQAPRPVCVILLMFSCIHLSRPTDWAAAAESFNFRSAFPHICFVGCRIDMFRIALAELLFSRVVVNSWTMNYNLDLRTWPRYRVVLNQWSECLGHGSLFQYSYCPDANSRHTQTQRTDCCNRTTKVVGNK